MTNKWCLLFRKQPKKWHQVISSDLFSLGNLEDCSGLNWWLLLGSPSRKSLHSGRHSEGNSSVEQCCRHQPSKSSVILTPIYWLLGVIYRDFEYLSDWFSSLFLRKNEAISGYPHVSTISGSSPQSPSKPPGDAPWPLCRCVLSVISPWIHHRTHHGLGASPTRKALAGNHEERVTQLWWLTLW